MLYEISKSIRSSFNINLSAIIDCSPALLPCGNWEGNTQGTAGTMPKL
jgi:hypothetical protein